MRRLVSLLLLLVFHAASILAAGPAYIVKDIRTVPSPIPNASSPACFAELDGVAYFRAVDPGGIDIWRSDGTEAGTFKVADTNGVGSLCPVVSGGRFYFRAGQPPGQSQFLWVSDGTVSGTAPLKASLATGLTDFDGMLFFADNDPVTGTELWKSDGTLSGTVLSTLR